MQEGWHVTSLHVPAEKFQRLEVTLIGCFGSYLRIMQVYVFVEKHYKAFLCFALLFHYNA
jgi:hypothetical protein